MKNLLKHTISFSMILILLVSTMQVSLYKMECLLSGNVKLSLNEFNPCNETPSNTTIDTKCCNYDHITFDLDYDSNLNLKTFQPLNSSTFYLNKRLKLVNPELKAININSFSNLPPPAGNDLLKRVQIFRL